MVTSLANSRIRLRSVEEKDLPTLYIWRNEHEFISLFSPRRTIVSYEKFVIEHKRDTDRERHQQFMIKSVKKNKVIGMIYSYNFNLTDGHVFMGGYIPEEFRKKGYGAMACAMLTAYLFEFFPLHKIYFEALEYNKLSQSMLQSFDFVEEGRFKEHRFYAGQRHDLVRFAAYRKCLSKIQPLLSKLNKNRKT
ncbi:MAG: GNAT family acetyltransferase [Candidatus Giovannonibacteria bacterium GW2011_GWA1_44_25]|uniref:GNAT family acetyltransferase n=1 Tax=Candidatus Giovannonibacteria bacterium GW2011_GWA1_44_25 TaxID=1618645 RepID=A0A0G1LG67_9BACT|nr:MAG: GNAT family acetyltransferase [Candidatus Giovannonibacteria bacterium GW2011_GWA1_44_25]